MRASKKESFNFQNETKTYLAFDEFHSIFYAIYNYYILTNKDNL